MKILSNRSRTLYCILVFFFLSCNHTSISPARYYFSFGISPAIQQIMIGNSIYTPSPDGVISGFLPDNITSWTQLFINDSQHYIWIVERSNTINLGAVDVSKNSCLNTTPPTLQWNVAPDISCQIIWQADVMWNPEAQPAVKPLQ